jgi:hypothetical protein
VILDMHLDHDSILLWLSRLLCHLQWKCCDCFAVSR